jgi:hypothetical protein
LDSKMEGIQLCSGSSKFYLKQRPAIFFTILEW